MDKIDQSAVIARYDALFATYGMTEQGLGWGPKGRSNLRFSVLASRWNFSNQTILDFGCGFGDFYGWMKRSSQTNFDYTGVDINSNLIEAGKNRYPEAKLKVIERVADIPEADYIVSSGVFNIRSSQSPQSSAQFIEDSFTIFAQKAKKGFCANFLSSKVSTVQSDSFHSSPEKILTLAYRFSNNIVLRNDYMPYEFTIFVDLNTAIDPKLTVYENYLQDV